MGIIEPPPVQDADQPQAAPATTDPNAGAASGRFQQTQMAYLDDTIQWASLTDTALTERAKTAHQQLMEQTGGTAQAVEAISQMERDGLLNAQIAQKFRESMIAANGNSDKFGQEVVRQRQQLQMAMASGTMPGGGQSPLGNTGGPGSSASEAFQRMLDDPKNMFGQLIKGFASLLNIDLKGIMAKLQQVPGAGAPTTAAPATAAPATAAPAGTTRQPLAQPATVTAQPSASATPKPAEVVSGETPTTRPGGTTYDVEPLPGGESPGVRVADGTSNLAAVWGHNSNPQAFTIRDGTQLPGAGLQTAALDTTNQGNQLSRNMFSYA